MNTIDHSSRLAEHQPEQSEQSELPTPTPAPTSTDVIIAHENDHLAPVIPFPRNSGNYGIIYPLSVDEVVDRVHEHFEKTESGLLVRAAQQYGLNPDWVRKQLAKPLHFGPAEQANPFITVFAHAKAGTASPEKLTEIMNYQDQIEEGLSSVRDRVKRAMLTLKYDSLSSGGPTAIYDFKYPSWSPSGSKPEAIVSKGKIDKEYERMPYYDLYLPQDNIRGPKGIIESITVQSCRKGELKGKGEGQLRSKWAEKFGRESLDDFDQGIQLFKNDLNSALNTALAVQKIKTKNLDTTKSPFNYYEFVTAFNRQVLSRFSSQEVEYQPVDQDYLDSLVLEGIDDWKTFLNQLSDQGFVDLQKDTILRFAVRTASGVNRFVRLSLAGSSSLTADGKRITEDNFEVVNHDTAGAKGGGQPVYRINDVLSAAREAAIDPDKRILFLAKKPEYFSLLSGLTNLMIGDDGIYHPDFVAQAEAIRRHGLGRALLYTYCPHNVGNSSYHSDNPAERIVFNDDCSFIHFYVYMIGLARQKASTREAINNLIK